MPEEAVRAAWGEVADVDAVAARLDVSQLAMGWRLFNLKLVEEGPV